MTVDEPPGAPDANFSVLAAFGGLASQICIEDFLQSVSPFSGRLERLDPISAAATFGGLLTEPSLQANCYRLEALIHLAFAKGRGTQKPTAALVSALFEAIGDGPGSSMEDPAEDVMVSAVRCRAGNFRVLEGLWEGGGFYLQLFLNMLEKLPEHSEFRRLRAGVLALLEVSDAVCERAHLNRWETGNPVPQNALPPKTGHRLVARRRFLKFTREALRELDVDRHDLEAFSFDTKKAATLLAHNIGDTALEKRPIVVDGADLWLMLPTAVSSAVRHRILKELRGSGRENAFNGLLASTYADLIQQTSLLGGGTRAPVRFARVGNGFIGEVLRQLDTGRYLHIVFATDPLSDFDQSGLAGIGADALGYSEAFDASVSAAHAHAKSDPDYRAGLTLIVWCGVGRGFATAFGDQELDGWSVEFTSAYDFFTLCWTPDFDALTLWRVLEASREVERLGTRLWNVNGLVNLVAWARALDGHMVPHAQMPDEASPSQRAMALFVDQNSQLALRNETALATDPRMERDVWGNLIRVRRDVWSAFEEDRAVPTYASEDVGPSNRPMSLFRARQRAWWADSQVRDSASGHLAYERWRTVCTWLRRAASVLDGLPGLPNGPVMWIARFEGDIGAPDLNQPPLDHQAARGEIDVHVDRQFGIVKTIASERFERAFAEAENIAERALVTALVEGVLTLAGHPNPATESATCVEEIVPGPLARHSHVFWVRGFRDQMAAELSEEPLLISREDDAIIRLDLGWQVRSREDGPRIEGKAKCTEFLNLVVSHLQLQICSRLRSFNRHHFLTAVLQNHERAAFDRSRWRRTSGAVLALHENRASTLDEITHHHFKLNGVFLASRILLEIGLCECVEEGGSVPGALDITRLMSMSALLTGVGGWSDAIRWDLMEPALRVTPLGDIHADFGWMDEIVIPFSKETNLERIEAAEASYADNLEENRPPTDKTLEPAFLEAWMEQFGGSFEQTRALADHLDDLGINRQQAVFELDTSELEAVHHDGTKLPGEVVQRMIDAFTLTARAQWSEIPAGFQKTDLWPWRLRRALSLLRRPILRFSSSANAPLLVAPGFFREAVGYTLAGMHSGVFPDHQLSPLMLAWKARANGRRGEKMAAEVASLLEANGWATRTEVQITEIMGRPLDRDYGDVDVLAWRDDRSHVLVIECKDVQYRKSEGEIAEQLSDFRGEIRDNGKPDSLRRHLDRVDVLSREAKQVGQFIGRLGAVPIESHLVFRNPVPMKYALSRMSERVRVSTITSLLQALDL